MGRDLAAPLANLLRNRFNPRARVGRDLACQVVDIGQLVSIHAPAWGATPDARALERRRDVSIHAPAWGATQSSTGLRCSVEFQSTRPRGARPREIRQYALGDRVSIHAPAWGATLDHVGLNDLGRVSIHAPAWGATPSPCPGSRSTGCFNPRARVGRDSKPSALSTSLMQFQSTRPRGARLFSCMFPTPPSWVSIHAPAWGATRRRKDVGRCGRVSIHAPAWGATISRRQIHTLGHVSIHAPAWGATRIAGLRHRLRHVSIHAPAWGATWYSRGNAL